MIFIRKIYILLESSQYMNYEDNLRREFNNYSPDEDPNGERGLALAEAAMKINGYDVKRVQRWARVSQNLEKIAQTALVLTESEKVAGLTDKGVRKKLSQIREAGYNVKPYSEMNAKEARNYLRQVRGEIFRTLSESSPEIAQRIREVNKD